MDSVALIAPDFSIILLGLLLRLKFEYSEDFWKQAERLVFYVLFPLGVAVYTDPKGTIIFAFTFPFSL